MERYKRSPAWAKGAARVRPDYERAFRLVLDLPRKSGGDLGRAPVTAIDAAAVDKIYERLKTGPRGERRRQANICIMKVARAWDVVQRRYAKVVPAENPWRGVELEHTNATRPAATRAEAMALANALESAGEAPLAAAALICFEWLQRPENVLAGRISWTDYRPADQPNRVRIEHYKTGAMVWRHLEDEGGPFAPELEALLVRLPKAGVAVVLRAPSRGGGPPRPYTFRDARARVRRIARAAGLPDWLTLDACRHGGMTEIGDDDLTESQEMSLSGHKTPDAKRRYVKKTDAQRLLAQQKRRILTTARAGETVAASEQTAPVTRNGATAATRNGTGGNG